MIAVVSHDAGGAEILSSFVRRSHGDYLYVLEGPARKIFNTKLRGIEARSLEDALDHCVSILCGTSWQSDIELHAIRLARGAGKRSVAFLDHWVNYRERFVRSNVTAFPDELWVGDSMAESRARQSFPGLPIKVVENPYVQDVMEQLRMLPNRSARHLDSLSILYVCEPTGEHAKLRHGDARHWGYVEEDALRFFLLNSAALGKGVERVIIRPHPSERPEKYSWVKEESPFPVEFGGIRTLLDEIADSDVVVGCESMAMVIALLAGKRVISCIPPGGRPCVLPHAGIISLHNLIKNSP